MAALASNLSQAFKYGIYSNEDIDEVSIIFLSSILPAKISSNLSQTFKLNRCRYGQCHLSEQY